MNRLVDIDAATTVPHAGYRMHMPTHMPSTVGSRAGSRVLRGLIVSASILLNILRFASHAAAAG